jgi:hypothetical protein
MADLQLDYRARQRLQPRRRLGKPANLSARNRLCRFLANEFDSHSGVYDLFTQFLSHSSFSKSFFLALLSVARDGVGTPWSTRRAAVLMLEHQILKISQDDFSEFNFVLNQLHLKRSPSVNGDVTQSVRKEGYTTTRLRQFIPEFRRRLERLNRIHARIRGWKTSQAALAEFIDVSRQECRLTLARYVFTPDEVVDEILRQVLVSNGCEDLNSQQPLFVQAETERGLRILPDFEAAILKKLCFSRRIYWVSSETRSEINSLVEYPLTTVVLVIKLPGSDIEFEIKRVGKRPPFSLGVVHARNGYEVAPSHRLDGGNMLWLLRHEANAASRLGIIYRRVHGEPAPLPTYVSRNTICSIPTRSGEQQTVNYFTDPAVFGDAFDEMRAAMAASVAAFTAEGYMKLPDLPGALGLTAQFLSTVCPGQAILNGTSSFRVDRIAAYLSPDGSARYFAPLSNSAVSSARGRSFADALLEEVLGVYRPPVTYRNYGDYLAAAFAISHNRGRADSVYKSILQQIGKLWGTLMGAKGYSKGESFVARNVGLRSVWHDGQWQVRTIFMDHDSLVIPGFQEKDFCACHALEGMKLDETYIWGRPGGILGTVGHLRSLYRIDDEVDRDARRLAEIATREAYQKTQRELGRNPKLRGLFEPVFIERLPKWNQLVTSFIGTNPARAAKWKQRTRKVLGASGYDDNEVNDYLEALAANRSFLERQSLLFGPGDRVHRGNQ